MKWLAVLIALFAVLAAPNRAQAEDAPRPRGQGVLVVTPPAVALTPRGEDTFAATIEIENRGEGPLRISRIDLADLPAGVGVAPSAVGLTIAPGQRVSVEVTWIPSLTRARDLADHLVIRSDARDPDGGERWVGISAQRGSPLDGWILSLLVGLPLLGLLGVAFGRRAHHASVAAMGATAAAAAYAVARFDPAISARDGHGGYQLIERWPLVGGVEYHLGVDGLSFPLVVAAIVIFLSAALRAGPDRARSRRIALHLGASGTLGALVTLDAALFVFFWAIAWIAAALAVRGRARGVVAVAGALSTAIVSVALSQMVAQGVAGHLADGAPVARSLSLVDLARIPWLERDTTTITTTVVLLVVGFAVAVPLAGASGWLRELLAAKGEHHAIVSKIAIYGVLRFGVVAMPDATRWAAPVLAGIAAGAVLVAAVGAFRAEDDAALSSHASVAHTGLALLALMGLTPAGIQACVLLLASDALARAVASTRRHRLVALAVGSGAVFAWGPLLAFVGAFARHPAATSVAALGWVLLLVAHLAAVRRRGDARDPEGSRIAALLLGGAAVLVAVYPRPLTWWMDRGAIDLHRRLDPPDGAQIAAIDPGASSRSWPG